ncbi:hypothetical protein EDB81DRAFT_794258 [Dactylonectria macrodidyma]|uniref:Uncharacterized protein n=1 Tax=Dactylonectria macrodidyma TaxID=307937 RepID=A0A9P9EUU2_9HYPO|nr:hypothetical protein EDB81DRAFT_794258 [Dactylonectria macrodidyma]
MTFRSMDPIMDYDNPPQKTIRSHEQNQERAFIAASRRGDRGIEARLQSARRASEAHKLRTGKALHVSRDIVLKEEMYEEVEDGFPRSYQLRGSYQRHSSVNTGEQVGEDANSPATMAESLSGQDQQLHESKIDREFAQSFPQVDEILSRRWSTQSIFTASPTQPSGFQYSPKEAFESTAQNTNYGQDAVSDSQSRSLVDSSPPELRAEVDLTPPSLATEFGSYPATPRPQGVSVFKQAPPVKSFPDCNCNYGESTFATNLSSETNALLADGEVVDPALYDQQWMYGTAPSDGYAVGMDMDNSAFSELYEDDLNLMSWDPTSQPKKSTDDYSWNMFENGNVFKNDVALGKHDD